MPAAVGDARPLPAGPHHRRRFLRLDRAARRPSARGARRRQRQGHSGGADHGADHHAKCRRSRPSRKKGLDAYVSALNEALCQRLAAGRFAATTFLLYDPQRETMEVICAGQFEPWRWRNDALGAGRPSRTLWRSAFFPEYNSRPPSFPACRAKNGCSSPTGSTKAAARRARNMASSGCARSLGTRATRPRCSTAPGAAGKISSTASTSTTTPASPLHPDQAAGDAGNRLGRRANCKLARDFIEGWALAAGYPDLERGRIVLAADEAMTNIIRHTYAGRAGQAHHSLAPRSPTAHLHLRLRDYGPPRRCRPTLKGRELEDIKPGGLGPASAENVFSRGGTHGAGRRQRLAPGQAPFRPRHG